jgi:hypothetical protein
VCIWDLALELRHALSNDGGGVDSPHERRGEEEDHEVAKEHELAEALDAAGQREQQRLQIVRRQR